MMLRTLWILSAVYVYGVLSDAATDFNKIENDGSFSFGLSNDDFGAHYHEATGSADKIVRGRYGSRNAENGRIEETEYTAGPRGFRARGPQIHRKMDLSQYPRGPIGTPDDPLADPYEDPSYAFNFQTSDHERRENADSNGRVKGLYSYLDDIGERHTVRYAAGAGTGFEVLNSVPDSPAHVAYSSPLYKAPLSTRGRMSTQRGPDGQYNFILSAPDQRRSESSGPDGIVRGSYSYLDDKGIQRTVQYIAGAGIGYRIVQSTTGVGTHLTPRPAIPQFGIKDAQSNDLADDLHLKTAESGRFRPTDRDRDYDGDQSYSSTPRPGSIGSRNRGGYNDRDRGSGQSYDNDQRNRNQNNDRKEHDDRIRYPADRNDRRKPGLIDRTESGYDYSRESLGVTPGSSLIDRNRGPGYNTNRGSEGSVNRVDDRFGGSENNAGNRYGESSYNNDRHSGGTGSKGIKHDYPDRDDYSPNRNRIPATKTPNRIRPTIINDDYDNDFPTITNDRHRLENDRERDFSERGHDSTLIKNVGKWYVGLPPGASVRAHVQNIDLLPLGGRQPSPSEALRKDELSHV